MSTLTEPISNVRLVRTTKTPFGIEPDARYAPACECFGSWVPLSPPLDALGLGDDAAEWQHAEGCSA